MKFLEKANRLSLRQACYEKRGMEELTREGEKRNGI